MKSKLKGHDIVSKRLLEEKFKDLIQPNEYKLIPLTKGRFAKVDNEYFDLFKDVNWLFTCTGYARNSKRQLMHRLVTNCPNDKYVDHINHDKLDNRMCNLRICNKRDNDLNKKPLNTVNRTSKYKGVCWDNNRLKWRANIGYYGKQKFLGRFECEIEAAKTYNEKAKELFGEFAYLNKI